MPAKDPADLLKKRFPEVWEFRETLSDETDRGCALMAAAYLDAQLEELIQHSFINDETASNEMLGQSKPLGTFSSRIDMSYLLGHISGQVRRDLHIIRKIRNDFGHNPKPIGFSSSKLANQCRELYHTFFDRSASPRKLFTSTVLGVLASIHVALEKARRPAVVADVDLPSDKKKQFQAQGLAIITKVIREIVDEGQSK
jgi:DNA-binding MltR family transcriptional regulator